MNTVHIIIGTMIFTSLWFLYIWWGNQWVHPILEENLINRADANYIIAQATPEMKPSTLISDKAKVDDKLRKSDTAWLYKTDPKIKEIMTKIVGSSVSIDNCEDMQVVRYRPGMYYKPHQDACVGAPQACAQFRKRGGERIKTFLVGLNTNYTGGLTTFPKLGKKFKAPFLGALVFYPLNKAHTGPHKLALHGGEEVHSGEKWIANVWVRQNKFI